MASTEPSEALVLAPSGNDSDNNSNQMTTSTQQQQQPQPQTQFDPNQMNNLFFWAIRNSDPEKLKQLTENADPNKTREKAHIFFGNADNNDSDNTADNAGTRTTTTTTTTTRRAIDPIRVIKEQLALLSKSQADREREEISNEDRFYSLIRLQDFIDKIDFANDFHKLNGTNVMLNIVNEFLDMDTIDEEVYTLALEALDNLATCLHNNSWLQTQDQYQKQIFPFIIETLKSPKLDSTRTSRMKEKLVSMLSALCSNQPVSLVRFLELSGVSELVVPIIRKNCENPNNTESNKLTTKLMFLLFNLMICEEEMSQKTNLAASILSQFDSLIIHLLDTHKSMDEESEIDLVEKTLLLLRDLAMAEHVKSDYQRIAKSPSGKLQGLLQEILKNAQSKDDADRFYDVKDYIEEINSY